MPRRVLLVAALSLIAAVAAGVAATTAAARTVWLCNPERLEEDPCRRSLTAAVLAPDGTRRGTERTRVARDPQIDCFYVYPTVSDQPRPQARRTIDPEIRSIAYFQASRFSSLCRVFAPVYRQITIRGLLSPSTVTPAMREAAFADVREAWRDYLRRHNDGRGVVIMGHSQGARVIAQLVDEIVEESASERARLVSALPIGINILVPRGRDVGGQFDRVPACRRSDQLRCAVAYSSFNETPPAESRFGRPPADQPGSEVLCVNPANLRRGGRGTLRNYVPTEPYAPGTTIGALVANQLGDLPRTGTPWIAMPDAYRGRCVREGSSHVLRVTALGGARQLVPMPDRTWGLHLADMNIAMGNLVALVERQARAYAAERD